MNNFITGFCTGIVVTVLAYYVSTNTLCLFGKCFGCYFGKCISF